MDRPDGTTHGEGAAAGAPLPNRFTASTALGCLGIAGVLALPAVFFLPLENWHGPAWVVQAIWLVAFAALAGGAWLLARVPASASASGGDVRAPVTHAGREPIREIPARVGNRIVLALLVAVVAVAATSYVATSAAAHARDFAIGAAVASVAGLTAVALGVGVASRRVPPPAWFWARSPIRAGPMPRGLAIALFGVAVLGWALFAAAGHGYQWGVYGLAVLVLISVLLPPLAARWPARGRERAR